jgi:transcriptional regulator with XRE-family HTH domain
MVNGVFEELDCGAELRECRREAGLSLRELAALTHYTKGHLSKVESGKARLTLDVARRCDAALNTGGRFARMVAKLPSHASVADADMDPGQSTWIMRSLSDGRTQFQAFSEGAARDGVPAASASWTLEPQVSVIDDAASPIIGFRALLVEYRKLGQILDPGSVVHPVIQTIQSLRTLALRTRGADRCDVLSLAARYAEYAGWMSQELGNDQAAILWTGQCANFAREAKDWDLVGYTLVRRAELALYQEDGSSTVEFATQVAGLCTDPYIATLALQREAQGHALGGDERACMRALEAARNLEAATSVGPGDTRLGSTFMPRPLDYVTGWCLHDLGQSAAAAEVLAAQLDSISLTALRARVRCASRLALAYAAAGNVAHAAATIDPVLAAAKQIDSATFRSELRLLKREFARSRDCPEVAAVAPRMMAALRTAPVPRVPGAERGPTVAH